MKTGKFLGLLAAGSLFLAGCVSPEVVTTNNIDDASLTCDEIKTQMGQLDEIRAEAKKGKTASGANVAAAILFWPAVIGNYSNANEAMNAANKRHEVLVALAKKKRCKF
ncbi:YgdI/YgdR family lipoprotein [Leisingera caerulea]|uniref:YgdI/YgdR family lipoprotein n=1 Tax=Leisingera caerulea TaxID=506591 RepID=A0A9Q9HLC8_LEICA|nr:hypothetical protein [Leisingera caerulea]UWQ50212.1 YgdI/YgdR family lipoprotein [Leisingera caerulea]UWQ54300.1 YgdI/YgdR family lipoprotein [Leisingera caerulea]UWQ58898.1 YgdI/YgdR family lipoprotein [Leisingera caerulea]UWQ83947.1 YgdI/YgdR family lipoprotein [Leisingera caerulea]